MTRWGREDAEREEGFIAANGLLDKTCWTKRGGRGVQTGLEGITSFTVGASNMKCEPEQAGADRVMH